MTTRLFTLSIANVVTTYANCLRNLTKDRSTCDLWIKTTHTEDLLSEWCRLYARCDQLISEIKSVDKDLAQYNASETIKLWDVYPNDRVDYTIGLMTQANDATARVYCLHTKCMDSIPNSYRPSQ